MKKLILGMAAAIVMALTFAWTGGTADAGFSSAACPFYDNETPLECQITEAWVVGGGGVGSNHLPNPPILPGPYNFEKTLRILGSGSIDASSSGGPGITLNINGNQEVGVGDGGAFIMDPNATFVETNDIIGSDQGAGPIVINATGGATLAAGTQIRAQNTFGNFGGGAITMTLGGSSTFGGLITSEETTGVTGGAGGNITINVTGNLTLAAGSEINSQKNADSAKSGDIAITVSGDMIMKGGTPGALITSEHPGATNGTPGGNITIAVGTGDNGTFTMESGSRIDSTSRGHAGNIAITAGNKIDIQTGARVQAGENIPQQTSTHGGRIFVIAGCEALIFGELSSKGADPGADLVHVEGCLVHVGPQGLIESTAPGHQPDTPTSCDGIDDPAVGQHGNLPGGDAGEVLRPDHPDYSASCVEIWARHVIIDAGGEVNADFALSGGTEGHGWIDIFAEQDIIINGPAVAPYAVHSNSGSGNDLGGDVRIKARHSFITMSGLAVQANATDAGGDGGSVEIEAGGNIALGTASIQAKGAPLGGLVENGGTIDIRSYKGTLTGGPAPGELNTDAEVPGVVTLQSCLGTNYTGNVVGTLVTPPTDCTVATPDFPAYVVFNPDGRWDRCGQPPATKEGIKFQDVDQNGAKNMPPDVVLANWPINLLTTGNVLVQSTTTDADGKYKFTIATPGTYRVCEGVSPLAGPWIQSFPNNTSPAPPDESKTDQCPPPNIWGYEFTVGGGQNGGTICCGGDGTGQSFINNDFGNYERDTNCPEDLPRGPLMTRTVNPGRPLGGGGVAGDPENFHTLQAAYNRAKYSPISKNEVIGMFSKTTENVVLDNYTAKTMTITQCTSAQITAKYSNQPVWSLTSPRKLLIIGPDSVGGTIGWSIETGTHELKSIRSYDASVAGVRINTNSNKVSFNKVTTSGAGAIGVDILGNSNTLTAGTIGPNSGAGVHIGAGKTGNNISGSTIQNNGNNGVFVEGNGNTIKSIKLKLNAPAGIRVTGNTNTIQSNQSDENTGDGYNIAGSGNIVKDNKANKNTQDGFDLSGTGQKITGSASSQTTNDYRISAPAAVSGPSSNKADGTSVPSSSKCNGLFTSTVVLTCN